MPDNLHGAVPIDLEWVEPDPETGRPTRRKETRYLYYNNTTVDRFQSESGLEMAEFASQPLPDDFPFREKLVEEGFETVADLKGTDADVLSSVLTPEQIEQVDEAVRTAEGFEARLDQLLEANDLSRLRFTSILLWSGLLWAEPDLSIEEVGAMTQGKDLETVYAKVNQAFANYAGEGDDDEDAEAEHQNARVGAEGKSASARARPASAS